MLNRCFLCGKKFITHEPYVGINWNFDENFVSMFPTFSMFGLKADYASFNTKILKCIQIYCRCRDFVNRSVNFGNSYLPHFLSDRDASHAIISKIVSSMNSLWILSSNGNHKIEFWCVLWKVRKKFKRSLISSSDARKFLAIQKFVSFASFIRLSRFLRQWSKNLAIFDFALDSESEFRIETVFLAIGVRKSK